MTVDEVGAKIGRSGRSLERWEAGVTCPLLPDAIAWCEALGMDFWPQMPGEF